MSGSVLFIGLGVFFAVAIWVAIKAYNKWKSNPPDVFNKK